MAFCVYLQNIRVIPLFSNFFRDDIGIFVFVNLLPKQTMKQHNTKQMTLLSGTPPANCRERPSLLRKSRVATLCGVQHAGKSRRYPQSSGPPNTWLCILVCTQHTAPRSPQNSDLGLIDTLSIQADPPNRFHYPLYCSSEISLFFVIHLKMLRPGDRHGGREVRGQGTPPNQNPKEPKWEPGSWAASSCPSPVRLLVHLLPGSPAQDRPAPTRQAGQKPLGVGVLDQWGEHFWTS